MTRDPSDRCASTNGARRCVLRPHPLGDHLALVPEGEVGANAESWGRSPNDGPTLSEWLDLTLIASPDPGPAPSAAATGASSERSPAPGSAGGHIPLVVSSLVPPGEAVAVSKGRVVGRIVNVGRPGSTGYTGDPCESCGSMRMVRTGTCATCQDCGSAGGCG